MSRSLGGLETKIKALLSAHKELGVELIAMQPCKHWTWKQFFQSRTWRRPLMAIKADCLHKADIISKREKQLGRF
jgi:hypothetical protein